jgi:uncharacterized protein
MNGKPKEQPAAAPVSAHRLQSPRRCDVRTLARLAQQLEGAVALADLPRLAASVEPPEAAPVAGVDASLFAWRAQGEERPVLGGEPQTWLHLQAQGAVVQVCQRCLQRMPLALKAERSFLFVRDEAMATQLDEELEDDVLVLPRQLDLLELVEDELILALPLVPRHETCPQPLPMSAADTGWPAEEAEPHPFAALAALKKPPRPS